MAYGITEINSSPGWISARAFVDISHVHSGGSGIQIGGGVVLSAAHVLFDPGWTVAGDTINLVPGNGTFVEQSVFNMSGTNAVNIGGYGVDNTYSDIAFLHGGPAAPAIDFIIFADPDEAQGTLRAYGYPSNGAAGYPGDELYWTEGGLGENDFAGGFFSDIPGNFEAWRYLDDFKNTYGFSGSGTFLQSDVTGDGEWYLAGIVSAMSNADVNSVGDGIIASLSAVYWDFADALQSLGLRAGVFGTHTLVAEESGGRFNGTYFNEVMIGSGSRDQLRGLGGKDELRGFNGVDKLFGGGGRDALKGGNGRDQLRGDRGNDKLWGGRDDDTFIFSSGFGRDIIKDFEAGSRYTTLDFENAPGSTGPGDTNYWLTKYGGLTWLNMAALDPWGEGHVGTGYNTGIVSGDWVSCNSGGNRATLKGSNFDLESAFLTAAWSDSLVVKVKAFNNGIYQGKITVRLDTDGPTKVNFKDSIFDTVDRVVFISSTDTGVSQFVMDDLTVGLANGGSDLIRMNGYSDGQIQNAINNATNSAKGAVLNFGGGDTITLEGLRAGELSMDMFA